jgi:chromosome partitioning protein
MYIVFTGDKGGVGKSTLAVLLTEWFLFQETAVNLIDADPNQTAKIWADKCDARGRRVVSPEASVSVVDTAGTSGSSLTRHILHADVIAVPFQPHVADLETVVGWFLSINGDLQDRVAFIPNRLINTIEQREGLSELSTVLEDRGRGRMVPGLSNRPAVYPGLLNGSDKNFFVTLTDDRVRSEAIAACSGLIQAKVG